MMPTDDSDGFRGGAAADEGLAADLSGLQPAAVSAGLRSRIGADLAAAPATPVPAARLWKKIAERLAWAAAGGVAASLAILVSGRERAGERSATTDSHRAVDVAVAEPGLGGGGAAGVRPRVAEQPIAWADEGVRFLDPTTPARVLRRMVLERHLGPDGRVEVRVPREDLIFLPVALR